MTFTIKTDRGFVDSGKTYTAPVVARKFNGYKVINPDNEIVFLCNSDIDIVSISDDERKMPIEF